MLLIVLAQVGVLQLPPQNPQDTLVFPPRETVMRLYTNCDEDRWPWGTAEVFVPKTTEEITAGVARRQTLETAWRAWYAERAGDTLPPTPLDQWTFPLAVPGRLLDNFANPRVGSLHEALDIFVAREGVSVRAPINGLVVAAGDDWKGGYTRRRGFFYEGDGLSRRSGNGAIIFDPGSGAFLLFSHLQAGVLVQAGDIVRAGQPLGRVGHTGNAAQAGHGRHLHFAWKTPGTACGIDSVLISQNPFQILRAARRRLTR